MSVEVVLLGRGELVVEEVWLVSVSVEVVLPGMEESVDEEV